MLIDQVRNLLDGTGDAGFAVDGQQFICAWNKGAEKFLGYPCSEILGKPCAPIFQGRTGLGKRVCSEPCRILDCALRGREISGFEMEVRAKSGRRFWVAASVLVFRDDRTNRHLLLHILQDINRLKKTERLNSELVRIARQITALPDEPTSHLPPCPPLTPKEEMVLRFIAEGCAVADLAKKLSVSAGTVRNHLNHVNEKLQTHNRLEAVFQARRRGII